MVVDGTGVLKSSGSVKFSEIATVYGYTSSSTANIKLGDYYKNGNYVKDSLETSIPDKTVTPIPSLSVSQLMGRSPRIAKNTTKTYTPNTTTYDTWGSGMRDFGIVFNHPDGSDNSGTLYYTVPTTIPANTSLRSYFIEETDTGISFPLGTTSISYTGSYNDRVSFTFYFINLGWDGTYNNTAPADYPHLTNISLVKNITPTFKNYY
jgi:hypothetical protein